MGKSLAFLFLVGLLFHGCESYTVISETANNNTTAATECLEAIDPSSNGFQSGDGSVGDPYIICTAAQLNSIGDNFLDKHFKILSNIDMDNISYTIIGSNEMFGMFNYKRFTGTIDGGGFEISNLVQDNSAHDAYGFVGALGSTGVLKNIKIKNALIDDSSSPTFNSSSVGGIAGIASGTIENCSFEGDVQSVQFNGSAGGLVGVGAEGLKIVNSYSKGAISSSQGKAAGLMAYADQVTISDSYFEGTITAERIAGGLVGELYANNSLTEIINSYAIANITSSQSDAGGLIGNAYADATLTIEKTFHAGNVTGGNYTGGIIGYGDQSSAYITLTESYHIGDVTDVSGAAGGVLGYSADIMMNNIYSSSIVTSPTTKGAVIGEGSNYVPDISRNIVWNSSIASVTDPIGDTPGAAAGMTNLTTAQMKNALSYPASFNFTTTWLMTPTSNDGFPTLR